MMNKIMVSISCTTYNHENYITDAIESFLMQKTNFAYEILIHDDASTDRTPEIIKEYELKYPGLIKPIYQKENQYSKGIKVGKFNRERAKGKYIAVCEGDDYWIDPYKLQKQVDYMEKHPECSLCVHAAYRVRPDKTVLKLPFRPHRCNKVFTIEEIIEGGGGLFPTNSMMYRAVYINSNKRLPVFYEKAPVGDYPLAIYLALQGSVYYIDEFMSAYRVGVPSSWTSRISSSSIKSRVGLKDKLIDMLDEINRYTDYKYDNTIEKTKKYHQLDSLLIQGRFNELKNGELREYYCQLSVLNKIKINIKQYLPGISKALINMKRIFAR